MKRFAALYEALDRTTSTSAKVAALADYLREAPPGDAAWGLFFLTGRRLERLLPSPLLHASLIELSQLPEWLVRECYAAVGDFAEAVSLLLDARVQPVNPDDLAPPPPSQRKLFEDPRPLIDTRVTDLGLRDWIEQRLLPLREMDAGERRAHVLTWWSRLDRRDLFMLTKLMTGELRVGVSRILVVRALSVASGLPAATLEGRLMGGWAPSPDSFVRLVAHEGPDDEPSQPYPFCLSSPLTSPTALGGVDEWLCEWKWDGIRAQLIHRDGRVFLWSRGQELLNARFPEIVAAAAALPSGIVLDGELIAFDGDHPRPFADLQRRIGRERRVAEIAVAVPVVFVAFDLLEDEHSDMRHLPLTGRRTRLEAIVAGVERPRGLRDDESDTTEGANREGVLRVSARVQAGSWEALSARRGEARSRGVEGLMLKRWISPYRGGRRRGDWWKWKIEPHTVDAVLIYAQPGSGRRATLFTDYTFGVWHAGELVPVAKAYSGLSDAEIDELDRWVRRHTVQRFGPVSAVEPFHVFELGFERIARSTRHRSGVAVRFPRMLRWRRDKRPADADTLETLERLLDA
jgi:DNA ligase-1